MPSLSIFAPGRDPVVYHLHKQLTSLGTDPKGDVVIPDPLLGPLFGHILFDGQVYTITTVDKQNDLVVNGKKRRKHKLSHRDKMKIGSAELRFDLVDESVQRDKVDSTASREVDDYKSVYDFSVKLMGQHNVDELLDSLMDAVIDITSADKGFLVLFQGETLSVQVARNIRKETIADAVRQLSDSIVAKVVRTREPVIVSDAMSDEEFASSESVIQLKLTSVLCVPLFEHGKMLGLIYVGTDSIRHLFARETLRALTVFAAQASLIVSNALLLQKLRFDNQELNKKLEGYRFGDLVGASKAMQVVYKHVDKVATTDISVLITGETGTGKELIAREIHRRSTRAKHAFVTINCGAIPENLLESELFGHVKGAFTGAVANKQGRFQSANGGTLFLDEIGEMPVHLQVKLLRVLQEKVVVPVGDTKPQSVDIRVVTATNRDLSAEIKNGNFREDLYYRLNVVNIELPPLRDRGDDKVVLSRYLLNRYKEEYQSSLRGFSPNATIAIKKHDWPGNIREMENRIKKAVVLADGHFVGSADLGLTMDDLPQILPLGEAREQFQRDYINEVLALNNGNRTKAARDLGVDPRTVFRHLEKEDEGTGSS